MLSSVLILLIWLWWAVSAQQDSASQSQIWWACPTVTMPVQAFFGDLSTYTDLYPSDLLAIAQRNRSNYCAANYIRHRQFEGFESSLQLYAKDNPTDHYIDSPYLFDHIVDVGMRYIDGDEKYQYKWMWSNAPWASLDPQWVERRIIATEFGLQLGGGIPLVLTESYNKFRWAWWLLSTATTTETCVASQSRLKSYNTDRATLTFPQKYATLCERSTCLLYGNKWNEATKKLTSCLDMTQTRILQEQAYVQWIITYQGTQMTKTMIEWYVHQSLTRDRFDKLFTKIVMMVKGLQFINDKVPEMTRMCSA